MPDDDAQRPSLTPPKLFGRRRSRASAPADSPADPPASSPADELIDTPTQAPVSGETRIFADAGLDVTVAEPDAPPSVREPRRPRRARAPRDPGRPLLPGRPAAVLSGLVAGGLLVALTWLGFRGCEAVQGTSSCGKGPGMLALGLIFVLSIVAGRYLLAAFRVPDPGATSFLAVGLTGVISLLFLVEVLDTWPMAIVIPAITGATFLLSWWVTTTFVDS